MPRPSLLDAEERRTLAAFAGAAKAVLMAVDRDLERDAGMPRAYYEILYFLDSAPERSMRMSELAEATRSQASRITHAVARLEESGFVRRELCAADRRGWFTVLTDNGKAALERARPAFAESVRRRLIAHLSPADRRELARLGELLLAAHDDTETDDERPRRHRDPDRASQGALIP